MRGPHNIFRLVRMGATLERTGAMNVILDAYDAPLALRVVAKVLGWPFQWLGFKGDDSMPPAPRALTALGPAYIKFGQILSTRPDVIGDELAMQMRVLQDKLPPFSLEEARRTIEQELERPVEDIFADLSPPVAAASIAQVHKATLIDTGEQVAIKVLRPGIEKAFRKDIDAFYAAARIVDMFAPGAKRLRPLDVIEHFEGVVLGELDLRLETSAAAEFADNIADDPAITVPLVKWAYSSKRVMTLDWAEGIPSGDPAAIKAAGHDVEALGENVLRLFLTHALRDGYFHADMHQGNLKISADGKIIAFDFGIMGRIDEYTRRVYAEILFGFIRRDYQRVAEVHFEAGYVPAHKDVDEFARALRAVGDPIFGMDASHISMGRLLSYLFEVTEKFGMETRTELILLQRTMVVVEGVSRSLSPQINIWQVARPVVEGYIKDSIGPKALAKDLMKTARILARFGPVLPQMAEAALIRANNPEPAQKPKRQMGVMPVAGIAIIAGMVGYLAAIFAS